MTKKDLEEQNMKYARQVRSMSELIKQHNKLAKLMSAEIVRLRALVDDRESDILRLRYENSKLFNQLAAHTQDEISIEDLNAIDEYKPFIRNENGTWYI